MMVRSVLVCYMFLLCTGLLGRVLIKACKIQHDCPGNQICILSKCLDPCESWYCEENAACETHNHVTSCQCNPGYLRSDPNNATSGCTECLSHSSCPGNKICLWGKCSDLCENSICGINSTCRIENNHFSCDCLPGFTRNNATNPMSPCQHFSKSATSPKKQFHLFNIEVDFPGADLRCREKGYRLARLMTKEENAEAVSIIKAQTESISFKHRVLSVGDETLPLPLRVYLVSQIISESNLLEIWVLAIGHWMTWRLTKIVTPGNQHVWLGGICLGKDLPNYWLNPVTTMNYTAFHPNNPSFNHGKERCLQFWLSGGNWAWNDDQCNFERGFLCETM